MYSHTTLPSFVTSIRRPLAPSVIRVFPFSNRWAPLMFELKNLGAE